MKLRRLKAIILTVALALSAMPNIALTAFASEERVSCETEGCSGVYENGFCTADSSHYQAAKQVSATHHSELKSTHNGYYAIENAGQLYWFAKKVDDKEIGTLTYSNYGGYTYVAVNAVLTDDIIDNKNVINANGELNSGSFRAYNPVGTYYVQLNGVFDGNQKTVSGLYCSDTSMNCIGLIAETFSSAIVKNVTVKDSYFSGKKFIGGIVGTLNSGKIQNCQSYATVIGDTSVGGIAGALNNSGTTAEDCTNYGNVYGENMVGGFAGDISYAKVTKCANFGNVSATAGGGSIGGFAGYVSYSAKLTNCFNAGNVADNYIDQYTYYGGFSGTLTSGTLTNCYTTGTVAAKAYNQGTQYSMGGFIGSYNSSSGKLVNCYYNKDNITKDGEKTEAAFGKDVTVTEAELLGVTNEDMKSGRVAYLLNGNQTDIVFKQDLKDEKYPNFTGKQVYYNESFDKYYNLGAYMIFGTKDNKAVVIVPEAGIYKLVFAKYENNALKTVKLADVVAAKEGEVSVDIPAGFTAAEGDKLMLVKDFTNITPLCEAYTVK